MDSKQEFDSPFLNEELFSERPAEPWEPRASALAAESPFQSALEPRQISEKLTEDRGETHVTPDLEEDLVAETEQDDKASVYEFEREAETPKGAWQRTNIQFRLTNYRGNPLTHYRLAAHIVDAATGKSVLLGAAEASGKSSTGTKGVVTYSQNRVPLEGSLVLSATAEISLGDDRSIARGEYVGHALHGTAIWKRRRQTMVFSVVQESTEIAVRSRSQQQLEEKLRKEGTIGLVLGPLEAKGGGGQDTGSVATSETETQFKVKLGLPALRIREETGRGSREAEEDSSEWEEDEELAEEWLRSPESEEPEDLDADEQEWTVEDSSEEETDDDEQTEGFEAPAVHFEREALLKAKPEIILVAGANYPKFDRSGSVWKRTRQLSAGPWRGFCLTLAKHQLEKNPNLKVTLFDFLLGTRENVSLNATKQAVTGVEHRHRPPIADDYWNLVGLNTSRPASFLKATLQPANRSSISNKGQIAYFDGANALANGKSIGLVSYLNAAKKFTSPVISITDVYAYIESLARSGKNGSLIELHFLAHAFNVMTDRYSGGPILLNSLDDPLNPERHPLDKDARAAKDFRKPAMDPVLFARAFGTNARSFIWGCNFQRGFIRQFVHQVGENGKSLAAGRSMKISYNSDWEDESEFRARLGLSSGVSTRNVGVDLAKVKQILKDTNEATYMQKLATASGHHVVGAPLGTYGDYDGSNSPLRLLHIPMTNDPFRNTKAKDSFERVLLFARDHLGFSFDTSFGDHHGLGRGYITFDP